MYYLYTQLHIETWSSKMSHNEMAPKNQLFLSELLYSETIGQDPYYQRVYNAKIDQRYLYTHIGLFLNVIKFLLRRNFNLCRRNHQPSSRPRNNQKQIFDSSLNTKVIFVSYSNTGLELFTFLGIRDPVLASSPVQHRLLSSELERRLAHWHKEQEAFWKRIVSSL